MTSINWVPTFLYKNVPHIQDEVKKAGLPPPSREDLQPLFNHLMNCYPYYDYVRWNGDDLKYKQDSIKHANWLTKRAIEESIERIRLSLIETLAYKKYLVDPFYGMPTPDWGGPEELKVKKQPLKDPYYDSLGVLPFYNKK